MGSRKKKGFIDTSVRIERIRGSHGSSSKDARYSTARTYPARYRQILTILASYGFRDIVRKIIASFPFPLQEKAKIRIAAEKSSMGEQIRLIDIGKNRINYEQIRLMLEALGPTFVKLGQFLSSRPDIIDPALAKELEKLQDGVPPFSGEDAELIIQEELGKPVRRLFASFDRTPIASASIAQVHKAVLFNGTAVAVKVQRPDIQKTVELDVQILKDLAGFAERHIKFLSWFQPVSLIDTFCEGLLCELDFLHEMENISRFTDAYSATPHLVVPRYYEQLSTRRVFCMEFVFGTKISELGAKKRLKAGNSKAAEYKPRLIADRFVTLVLKQIFTGGYFHGDPHPGNILVTGDNDICFIDFGLMGTITERQKEYLTRMLIAIPSRNMERFTRSLLGLLGVGRMDKFEALKEECSLLLEKYVNSTLANMEISKLIQDMIQIITSFRLMVPPSITMLGKAMAYVETVAYQLDPTLNILDKLLPFIKKLTLQRLSPVRTAERVFSSSLSYAELLENLPDTIQEFYSMVSSGNLRLQMDIASPRGIETLNNIANRVVFGLVLAALIISSSVIVFAKIPPLWWDISIIGIGGFLLSGLLGFGFVIEQLIRSFRRHRGR
ncbi:MAG: AarF/ABC1/UbiB kinase family protein [Spirochaetaceae bacterium]|jgi:ubiquinone biosynthesis protein|nr:AarF/ABC1/UbiB kinase family protein [Spirochaetaceae bacterium]